MKPHERSLLLKTGLLGVALALTVAAMSWFGLLDPLEHLLSDRRARWFQFFTPTPTTQIVHLDIDDGSIAAIGRLPWNREVYAAIIDELTDLDARAIGLDVTFPEHEAPHDGIDPDALLAQAVKRSARVILPVDFDLAQKVSDPQRRMTDLLTADLEFPLEAATKSLRGQGVHLSDSDFQTLYLEARSAACMALIERELAKGPTDLDTLRRRLLPRTDPMISDSPLLEVLREQYGHALSFDRLRRLSRPIVPGLPPAPLGPGALPPIPELAAAVAGTAFVDYVRDSDDVVRYLPMWVQHDGRLYPQLGLMLACFHLGVNIADIRIEPDAMVIPRPDSAGGELRVPLDTVTSATTGENVAYVMTVPWFGPPQRWDLMFRRPDAHRPVTAVWDLVSKRRQIRHNNALIDDAVKALYERLDQHKLAEYEAHPPGPDDADARAKAIKAVLDDAKGMGYDAYLHADPRTLSADELPIANALHALDLIPRENPLLQQLLDRDTNAMRSALKGKTVLIGLTASSALDIVPTPLYTRCPGVVVHGAVFNAVLTGDVWRTAPAWAGPAVALALGLLAAGAVAFFSPMPALAAVLVLAAAFCFVDALVLFDYGNFLLPPAAPLVAMAAVWSGGTLRRFVVERAERRRITRRFQNYVDPALVDYILENPDKARLDGEVRVMTVVFTDLANFTTLSERLREETVPMLNEYMSLMLPLVMERRGYVNKFFGDGIMFFFGAPYESASHAVDALDSVLAMQRAMKAFNETLTARQLPNVSMRAGVSSGSMVVGDAGSRNPDRADYTVLGNEVNLASRLEGANKALGTHVLVTQATAEMAGQRFLFRPAAKLQVVGKTEGVMTLEPLAPADAATDQDRRIASLTRDMVEPFLRGDFASCLKAADLYAQALGHDKLEDLYRRLSTQYLEKPPGPEFDGRITLSEK